MKFRILIIYFFLISCAPNYTKLDNRKPYNSTGFAYIFNENDYNDGLINYKMNNETLQISHKSLRTGTLIKLINPKTKDTIVLKNIKKTKYPDFYKILISELVAKELNINNELPLIEILEIKKNKSFIAKKAKVYKEEKKIPSKAPVTLVEIANISKKKSGIKKITVEKIYILVASFSTQETAIFLKQRIIKETPKYDGKNLTIRKKNIKEFEVLSGPYKSINLLKNDYIKLKNFGFEELDIFIND